MVKRSLAVLVTMIMVLGMTACGSKGESAPAAATPDQTAKEEAQAPEDKQTAPEQTAAADAGESSNSEAAQAALKFKSDKDKSEWKIAVVVKDSTNSWFVHMEDGVKKFAADTGINAYQKGPAQTDAALQVQVVQDLIAQGVDALCVVPTDPATLEPILEEAMNAGIVVITHEASTQENTLFDMEAVQDEAYGGKVMETLAEAMGGEGVYTTMVGHVTNASHNLHADAGIALQKEKYPNMKLLDAEPRVECEDDTEKAYNVAKELFKKYPDLKGIMCTSGKAAPGVARAIDELGLKDKAFTAGTGTKDDNLTGLENGTISGVLRWNPEGAGYAMCDLAAKILAGEPIAEGVNLDFEGYESMIIKDDNILIGNDMVVITPENKDNYEF
ncbi:substrate-binding domain-containing protein [Diplocloster agilis]|uniref:substrate-binding domain-containing protein n=1 Tax=Diplocloster agilis TaxID=2850323 RepID=UPI0008225A11|nr:substrate-binding domain-containing protein [Suonthocola fibrivorans]MCU6734395.1 substrate-binding domain-containing protein [Suonthocola fibrivorans]SCJ37570.1 D-ribose-binding periplasmic protein precursor [uncultured Clostridium sp.]